jgi:FkbH-like protein
MINFLKKLWSYSFQLLNSHSIDELATRKNIINAYRLMLGREPKSEEIFTSNTGLTRKELHTRLIQSFEYEKKFLLSQKDKTLSYSVPNVLSVTPLKINRVLLIGSCNSQLWADHINSSVKCDFLLFNNSYDIGEPPVALEQYDFQIIQIPIRSVVSDKLYFTKLTSVEECEKAFEESCQRLELFLSSAMKWNKSNQILSFAANYQAPQQNSMGRLMPRYDLRNFSFFVEKLNKKLCEYISRYNNSYLLDIDQLSCLHGRRYMQDDSIWHSIHGGAHFDGNELEYDRIEKVCHADKYMVKHDVIFPNIIFNEIKAMYKTIKGQDQVKAIVVDLDDTLWRGLITEDFNGDRTEGWPIGFWDALLQFKKRGGLLGIISKNDSALIERNWESIFYGCVDINDFAIRKINRDPKPDNMLEIINALNILPSSVLFIDDNPRERAAIKEQFPDIRVLGENPYLWRHIVLFSPETQVPFITDESMRRTEIIHKKIERDEIKSKLSAQEFLSSLNLKMRFFKISGENDPKFNRTFELINKTNQFNTTGKRWKREELLDLINVGKMIYSFEVSDKFSSYGLVGSIICSQNSIDQFVMSCRVVGLDIELAAMSAVMRILRSNISSITAVIVKTQNNLLSHDLFKRCGFDESEDGLFRRNIISPLTSPSHVQLLD